MPNTPESTGYRSMWGPAAKNRKFVNVEYWNYKRLHPEGKDLIRGWFNRAWHKRKCRSDKSFEPFILCWIAFNSWAACVTGEDEDRHIIKCLKADKVLSAGFATLAAKDQSFAETAKAFRTCWPIFKVQELRHLKIRELHSNDRRQVVEFYIRAGSTHYTPKVLRNGLLVGSDIPLTWPNAIDALYRVRCNLIHGDKRLSSEADQQIVGAAFRVLVEFFKHCLGAPEALKNL